MLSNGIITLSILVVLNKDRKKDFVSMFIMMSLDSMTTENAMNRRKAMNIEMAMLKSAGEEGVMIDVWWGLVERKEQKEKEDEGKKMLHFVVIFCCQFF